MNSQRTGSAFFLFLVPRNIKFSLRVCSTLGAVSFNYNLTFLHTLILPSHLDNPFPPQTQLNMTRDTKWAYIFLGFHIYFIHRALGQWKCMNLEAVSVTHRTLDCSASDVREGYASIHFDPALLSYYGRL